MDFTHDIKPEWSLQSYQLPPQGWCQQENDRNTALVISSKNGDSEVVNLLLKHGWNLEHQTNDSITTRKKKTKTGTSMMPKSSWKLVQTKEDPTLGQQCHTKKSSLPIEKGRKRKQLLMGKNRYQNIILGIQIPRLDEVFQLSLLDQNSCHSFNIHSAIEWSHNNVAAVR